MSSLWLGDTPLVLASGSPTRRALLLSAGMPVDVVRPVVDERGISLPLEKAGANGALVARRLARAKAVAGSRLVEGRLTLGADQTLVCERDLFHKPVDRKSAAAQLASLSDRAHSLHSALALALDGRIVWMSLRSARLTMRPLTPKMIERYLDVVGELAFASVGGYQIEGVGIQLFEQVNGDHSTILGLPLLPLLAELRRRGLLSE
ncbi:MAG: Maf family protein [Beijerinckiaceae bacterium]